MSSATLPRDGETLSRVAGPPAHKLIVSWQDPSSRAMIPIGVLEFDGDVYSFAYLQKASELTGFQPLLGFPELQKRYESAELFALFAQRAMDSSRPDFDRYISELGLTDDASTPWEQISRSGGSSEGDTIQLFPVPRYQGGEWRCHFLAAGVRHLLKKSVPIAGEHVGPYKAEELEDLLSSLSPGDQLSLISEPTNDWTSLALIVATDSSRPVGYVPTMLLDAISEPHQNGLIDVCVSKVNSLEAGWHLRLIVELTAHLEPEFEFFKGDDWALATSS